MQKKSFIGKNPSNERLGCIQDTKNIMASVWIVMYNICIMSLLRDIKKNQGMEYIK